MRYGERICRIVRSCAQDFSIYSQRRSDNSSLLPWTLNKMDLKELNLLLPFEFGPLSQLFEKSAESKSPPRVTSPVSKIQSCLNKELNAPIRSGAVKIKAASRSLDRRESSLFTHKTATNI